MAGTDLKPCPFCGGEARICAKHFTNGIAYAWVECGRCHAKSRYSDSIEDLSLAWNARAERIEVYPDGELAWVTCKCGEDIERHDRIQTCPSCGRKVME